jgi:hypothetical protein
MTAIETAVQKICRRHAPAIRPEPWRSAARNERAATDRAELA